MRKFTFSLILLSLPLSIFSYEVPCIKTYTPVIVEKVRPVYSAGVKGFLKKMALLESTNVDTIVSNLGYLGKYQFSPRTIKGLGFNVTKEAFLHDADLQDSVAVANMHYNAKVLRKYIKEYEGQTIDSIYITKSGLLAGACLVGSGGVISFLTNDNKYPTIDANGVSIKKYLRLFNTYRLQEI